MPDTSTSAHCYCLKALMATRLAKPTDLKTRTFVILFQAHITDFNDLCQVHVKSTFSVFF